MPPSWACRAHILGTFKDVRVNIKLLYRGFLLHLASQLYCGAGVPLDPQEELMVTRDHRSVPFWDPRSQPECEFGPHHKMHHITP